MEPEIAMTGQKIGSSVIPRSSESVELNQFNLPAASNASNVDIADFEGLELVVGQTPFSRFGSDFFDDMFAREVEFDVHCVVAESYNNQGGAGTSQQALPQDTDDYNEKVLMHLGHTAATDLGSCGAQDVEITRKELTGTDGSQQSGGPGGLSDPSATMNRAQVQQQAPTFAVDSVTVSKDTNGETRMVAQGAHAAGDPINGGVPCTSDQVNKGQAGSDRAKCQTDKEDYYRQANEEPSANLVSTVSRPMNKKIGATDLMGEQSQSNVQTAESKMENECKTIMTSQSRLLALARQTANPLLYRARIERIGVLISEIGTSLKGGIEHGDADLPISDSTNTRAIELQPPSIQSLIASPVGCSVGLCGASDKDQETEIQLHELEIIPNGIGLSCDKYVIASELGGDKGNDIPSGKKRKVCNNRECATWRHKQPVKTDAKRVARWIRSATDELLSSVWLQLEGPPELTLTGYDIKRYLLQPSTLRFDIADALVRMFRSLENEKMAKQTRIAGRHYISPNWVVNLLSGNSCMDGKYEDFMSPTPPYDIRRCNTVLTLVVVDDAWSSYAFDFSANKITVMDPNVRHPIADKRARKHKEIIKKMLPDLIFCMRKATGFSALGVGAWTLAIMLGNGNSSTNPNSGIQALNCMRWYNGNSVCIPPYDSAAPQTRRDFVYQLLAMEGNLAGTDVIAESDKEERALPVKKARMGTNPEGEGSTNNSSNSNGAEGTDHD